MKLSTKTGVAILALVSLILCPLSTGMVSPVKAIAAEDWVMRSETQSFCLVDGGAGITSMDDTGKTVTPENAAAILKNPLGYSQFEIAFDITWGKSNPVDTDENYGDTYVYMFLTTSNELDGGGNEAYDADNRVVLKSRHMDVAALNGASSLGTVSLGSNTAGHCLSFADGVTECHLSFVDNVLTFSVYQNGTVWKQICINYRADVMPAFAPKYLGVAVEGNHGFTVSNLRTIRSDAGTMQSDWLLRDMPGGFALTETDGITSRLNSGTAAAGSTAIYKTPVGTKNFSATFDLTWGKENPNEGENGYLGSFLSVYLTDVPAMPEGSDGWLPHNSFRVTTNHFQAAEVVGTTPSAGIVDFGGKTLENMTSTGTSTVCVEVKNDVFSMCVLDGATKRGVISYAFAPGTFTESKAQYLGFSLWGTTYCTIENVQISHDQPGDTPGDATEEAWNVRDNAVGFGQTESGITSVLDTGIAQHGSAALWGKAVGTNRFTASFDLTWNESNLQEGQAGYTGSFLYVYVTDSPWLPAGEGEHKPSPGFRVTTNHFQAADPVAGVSTPSTGIVDFGGHTLKNMSGKNTSKVYIELLGNVLYLYVMDGTTKRGEIFYTFASGYFTPEKPQYVGVSLYGNDVACTISNLTVYDVCTQSFAHTWAEATCTAPKTCTACGKTEGEALGHTWQEATCQAPKTCSACGETEGEALEHNYENGACKWCGEADPNAPVDEGTLVSTQKYNNRLTFEVYEMADGSHKLVVSGTGVMPTAKQAAGYEFLNYSATIDEIVIGEGVTSVGYGIFNGWTALASVELSGTITTIDGESFRGCTALKAIDIPDSVTTLGYGAFWGAGLESVVVPESVTSIKNYVFYRCKSLVSAEIYGTTDYKVGSRIYKAPGARMFSECSKLENIVLGDNINLLNTYCFHGTAITEFTVPARVKFIYDAAFHSCTKMTKFVMEEGVTYLGWAALFGCSSLTDVSIPETITGGNIATWAFGACTSLESIELPSKLTNLKKRTFSGCTSLKSIELPETVTTLGDRVFIGCTALESVKLSNITAILEQTFNNCPKLTSITIPETVTSIGDLAFRLNSSLKTVYIDSATIAAGLTGNAVYGNMIKWAETIAIRADIENVPSYVTSNYKTVGSVTVDGVEYITYSK